MPFRYRLQKLSLIHILGNLIQSIPVYKPVQQPVQVQKNPVTYAVNPAPFDKGPFADAPKYTYQPARPLSPGTTAPKGARPVSYTHLSLNPKQIQKLWLTLLLRHSANTMTCQKP